MLDREMDLGKIIDDIHTDTIFCFSKMKKWKFSADKFIERLQNVTQEDVRQEIEKRKYDLHLICLWCERVAEIKEFVWRLYLRLEDEGKLTEKIRKANKIIREISSWTFNEMADLGEKFELTKKKSA